MLLLKSLIVIGLVVSYINITQCNVCNVEKKWVTKRCANIDPEVDENTITLIGEENGRWPVDKFCYAFRNNMKVSGPYEMSVDFLGVAGTAFPTLIFNMWDECNYDHLHKELSFYLNVLYICLQNLCKENCVINCQQNTRGICNRCTALKV